MSGIIATANDDVGVSFLQGMMECKRRMDYSKELFWELVRSLGYKAWHIHDGWVRKDFRSGVDLDVHDELDLTWISEHEYSHSNLCPDSGDLMVLVKDSLDIEGDVEPFNMWVYSVRKMDSYVYWELSLLKIGVLQARYNPAVGKYEVLVPDERKNKRRLFRCLRKK